MHFFISWSTVAKKCEKAWCVSFVFKYKPHGLLSLNNLLWKWSFQISKITCLYEALPLAIRVLHRVGNSNRCFSCFLLVGFAVHQMIAHVLSPKKLWKLCNNVSTESYESHVGTNVNCWSLLSTFYDLQKSPCPVTVPSGGYGKQELHWPHANRGNNTGRVSKTNLHFSISSCI